MSAMFTEHLLCTRIALGVGDKTVNKKDTILILFFLKLAVKTGKIMKRIKK